ncbi:Rieske 2Fe-2S domain-containing protein [Leekyejoonella antrihumi]|uniref:Rieske 2Fe-2S domain-containing protein n=1 Tax=Leekyejoonella antrihumi TaxID=1660198 RepID=A0A563DUP9_9MICO|nr:Rieske 2Fe-2S domain-containing protein [Leekyejoonella antrihumi]
MLLFGRVPRRASLRRIDRGSGQLVVWRGRTGRWTVTRSFCCHRACSTGSARIICCGS